MGIINVLDTQTSNMIAAGEVVDRPASAVKEMLENSVDAGAKNISVEIKGGGMTFISISDDGSGIMRDDLPKTILRHATSKIKTGSDLDGVRTLGFRGEALAAISSVSLLQIISKRRGDTFGSRLSCDDTGVELYEAGCPDGTTVIVQNLFYNVPARRKFMKKDSSEAAACLAACEKLALSHPEISVSFSSDNVRKFKTSGDGKLYSVIYTLYGAEFARTLLPVEHEQDGVTVYGYISKPEAPRGSRNMQSFFVNNRYVRSKTVQAAVEEAYRSYIPSGKFPAAILFVSVAPTAVDVNVHPAKTEIKFADERTVFSAVHYAVLGALSPKPYSAPQTPVKKPQTEPFAPKTTEKQPPAVRVTTAAPTSASKDYTQTAKLLFDPKIADSELTPIEIDPSPVMSVHESAAESAETEQPSFAIQTEDKADAPEQTSLFVGEEEKNPLPQFTVVGEAYHTYIIVEMADKLLIIDKHAAHERLLYEELKSRNRSPSQELLFPVTLALTPSECEILLENAELLKEYGFVLEPFGSGYAAVRAVPARMADINGLSQILEGFAHDLAEAKALPFGEKVDKALYTMACKAAVKAGDHTHADDAEYLVRRIFETGVKYCPHGRPFIKELPLHTLEKFFDR